MTQMISFDFFSKTGDFFNASSETPSFDTLPWLSEPVVFLGERA